MSPSQPPENPDVDSSNSRLRQPKGDHNRRISLGMDIDSFANEAGILPEALRNYETTGPDHRYDALVSRRVGETLDRLEALFPNSQTGRQTVADGVMREDLGHLLRGPLLKTNGDQRTWPRYEPGGV